MTDFRRPLHDETTLLHVAPAPPHRSCFDDEIAIDFPSIHAVVQRMRDEFLGEDGACGSHAAVITVSARQAFAGTTVALHVPVRHTCSNCGGRGETWAEPCVGCAGAGVCSRDHQVSVMVPAGVTNGTRFRFLVATPHGMATRIEVTVLVA